MRSRKAQMEDALPLFVIIISLIFMAAFFGAYWLKVKAIDSTENKDILDELKNKEILNAYLSSTVPGKDMTFSELIISSFYSDEGLGKFNELDKYTKSYFLDVDLERESSTYEFSYPVILFKEIEVKTGRTLQKDELKARTGWGILTEALIKKMEKEKDEEAGKPEEAKVTKTYLASSIVPSYYKGRVIELTLMQYNVISTEDKRLDDTKVE